MDKQQAVGFIKEQLRTGLLSKDDLLTLVGGEVATISSAVQGEHTRDAGSKSLIHVLYGVGAIIAIVGVVILIAQNWDEIGFSGRLLVTLGVSFFSYAIAMALRSVEQRVLSQVLYIVSSTLAPLGVFVLLQESQIDFSWMMQFWIATGLFVVFGSALMISKRNILVLIPLFFASWGYYALIWHFLSFDYSVFNLDVLKWASILLGACYILVGLGYSTATLPEGMQDENERKAVKNALYGLGTLAVLTAGISLGGVFDLIYIVFIFTAFYGSVFLKSRAMLLLGALFLVAHIINLTEQYFVDSIGWPVALILIGFLVIGIGYGTLYLNRKFIS